MKVDESHGTADRQSRHDLIKPVVVNWFGQYTQLVAGTGRTTPMFPEAGQGVSVLCKDGVGEEGHQE